MSPPMLLSQVASSISILAGALMAKTLIDSQKSQTVSSAFPRCPTCNGTRRVPCLCNRWSDGDVGCGTCGGSGRRMCSSCGGSGTGRPIPVSLRAQSSSISNRNATRSSQS